MDYLMKLVTMALEWSYEAKALNVRPEMLEKAAELLVLRRDTRRSIDGAGPSLDAFLFESRGQEQVNETEGEGDSTRGNLPENTVQSQPSQPDKEDQTASTRATLATSHDAVMDQKQPAKSTKCTFSRVLVPIDLKRFRESGVDLVECPDCASTRTLEPHGGVLRFKPHDKRKTSTPHTEPRWAKAETDWDVVGALEYERNAQTTLSEIVLLMWFRGEGKNGWQNAHGHCVNQKGD